MPRLKKMSYALRKRTGKMRRKRERELDWQMRHDEMDRQRQDTEYYQRNTIELEDVKSNTELYPSSFTPDWTESNDDSQSLQCEDSGCGSKSLASDFPKKRVSKLRASQSGVRGGNSRGGGSQQIKKERSSPLREEDLDMESLIADIKVEHDDPDDSVTVELNAGDIDGKTKAAETTLDQTAQPTDEPIDPLSCVEVDEEDFVVDCDPTIVSNPGLSSDLIRSLSSDDNSNYSSSSNNQFFEDIMKNNELFYKQIANSPNTMNDAELARALQDHYDKLESINEDMFGKRKKAAAIQRRRRKRMLERMNEEQLKLYRASQTEACRQRRVRRLERMSEEEKASDRMLKNALCLARRHRRESMMSEEERLARRAAAAAAQRDKRKRKRQNMSEGELKAHKAEVASIWRMRRHLRYMKMTEEERQAERAKAAEAKRISRQRQKGKDDSTEETVQNTPTQTQRRPRRKRGRSQVALSESESDILESNNYGIGSTTESLISQILKQTQHIAEIESQQVDLVPEHPLVQLSKDQPCAEGTGQETYLLPHEMPDKEANLDRNPKVTNETYLLPHEIPDKELDVNREANQSTCPLPHQIPEQQQPNIDQKKQQTYLQGTPNLHSKVSQENKQQSYLLPHETPEESCPKVEEEIKHKTYLMPPEHPLNTPGHHHKVTQNVEGDRHNEMPQEFHHGRVQDGDQMRKLQQIHHSEIQNEDHSVASHLYPRRDLEDESRSAPPGQFYTNKGQMNDQMEAAQQLHHRTEENNQMSVAQQYHHGSIQYANRAAALHQYHHGNIQGIERSGPTQQFDHSENQDNQAGALQQYHHGRNYMNTLY